MKRLFLCGLILLCIGLPAFAQGTAKAVNLVVYVAGYTPDVPQSVGPKLVAAKTIADQYQKAHPGVTIEFYPAPADASSWQTALKTALAGELRRILQMFRSRSSGRTSTRGGSFRSTIT